MKGKLIVIEGIDGSGKSTQLQKVTARLQKLGYRVGQFSFPNYDSPTGKIIGGPFLGKTTISPGWFPENAPKVDPLVASAYYTADRRYNRLALIKLLQENEIVILDRYVESNLAYQGGKLTFKKERQKMYQKLLNLEYEIMELPRPDMVILLTIPFKFAWNLMNSRSEKFDENEADQHHLKMTIRAYSELAILNNFYQIKCVANKQLRSIQAINNEICQLILASLKGTQNETRNL